MPLPTRLFTVAPSPLLPVPRFGKTRRHERGAYL